MNEEVLKSKDIVVVSVEEARKIMGESNNNYTDKEIEEVIAMLTLLSDIAIDNKIKSLVQGNNL